MRQRLTHGLASAGFAVDGAATAAQALHQARGASFDALTLDLGLPDRSSLDLLARIRSEGPSRGSPVVGVTMDGDAGSVASFAIADILFKPIRGDEIAAVMARLPLPSQEGGRVMVIDDDPLALELMRATLAGIGLDAVCLADGRRALQELDLHRPQAIVLDLIMPDFDGFAVLDALHRLPAWRDTPVFIWTSMLLTEEEHRQLAQSAHAILDKGGGGLATMLERLRHWRPSALQATERA
jgi:CheY-like chemotaxis protein